MAAGSPDLATIEAEIDHIRSLGLDALRARWRTMFGRTAPAVLPKDLLVRMITYRMQEAVLGALDGDAISLLDDLRGDDKPIPEGRRRLKPGTVLVREYQGERHTVTVASDGYIWNGSTYGSLSTIARAITGTAWGGPRFFGLRRPGGRNDVTDLQAAEPSAQQSGRVGHTARQGRARRQFAVSREVRT